MYHTFDTKLWICAKFLCHREFDLIWAVCIAQPGPASVIYYCSSQSHSLCHLHLVLVLPNKCPDFIDLKIIFWQNINNINKKEKIKARKLPAILWVVSIVFYPSYFVNVARYTVYPTFQSCTEPSSSVGRDSLGQTNLTLLCPLGPS